MELIAAGFNEVVQTMQRSKTTGNFKYFVCDCATPSPPHSNSSGVNQKHFSFVQVYLDFFWNSCF